MGARQFNADRFEAVDGKRLITGKAKLPHAELPFIFVRGRGMVILLLRRGLDPAKSPRHGQHYLQPD